MYPHSPRSFGAIVAAALLSLLGAACASAQVTFTVTATANSSAAGYVSGQSYTFAYTTVAGIPAGQNNNQFWVNSSSPPYSNIAQWADEIGTDAPIVGSLTGSGFSGSYVRPTTGTNPGDDTTAGFGVKKSSAGNDLYYWIGTDSTTGNIGVSANGNYFGGIELQVSGAGLPSFTYPGTSWVDHTTYFSSYYGTYTNFSGGDADFLKLYLPDGSWSNTLATFTPTSVTIAAASAIPEPSTYAAFVGLSALGLVVLRRRRQTAA